MFSVDHIAVWCRNLEAMVRFYTDLFGTIPSSVYHNEETGFTSVFLALPGGGCRIELMHRADKTGNHNHESAGLAHLAIRTGTTAEVDSYKFKIAEYGGKTIRGPRTTGDGYYELECLDIEGNILEIVYYKSP